jgi:hypothetical protein
MPIQLSTASVIWPEDSDVCVATRYNKIGTSWATTIVYSGPCDFQQAGGSIVYNEAGVVVQADARCFIDASPLPDIRIDDELVFNGDASNTYLVMSNGTWSMEPVHMELALKRGARPYAGKT